MSHFMKIKCAKKLARAMARELGGVTRCKIQYLGPMDMTATEKKAYIGIYVNESHKVYPLKYSKKIDEYPCFPHHWRIKPRGAAPEEWQPIPEEFIEEMIQKYEIS